jgi:hypothetical protein
VDPHAKGASVFSGSYTVKLGNGQQLKGTFLSNYCAFDPGDCD